MNKSKSKVKRVKSKAWIIGNIISFTKPDYKSPFFGIEEIEVIRTLPTKLRLEIK